VFFMKFIFFWQKNVACAHKLISQFSHFHLDITMDRIWENLSDSLFSGRFSLVAYFLIEPIKIYASTPNIAVSQSI